MKYPLLAGLCSLTLAAASFAGDFNGSKPLTGTTERIIEINRFKIIDNVDADTLGLPKNFWIDFKAKRIRPSKESLVRRTIAFTRFEHIENKLVIQGVDQGVEGVEDGLAWSLTISKKDGTSILTASRGGIAYVVFGTCTPVGVHP